MSDIYIIDDEVCEVEEYDPFLYTNDYITSTGITFDDLDRTLEALQGPHENGDINITMRERRLFAALLNDFYESIRE